jgi:rubrerythrin
LAEKLKLLYDIFKKAVEHEREAQKMFKAAISLCEDNRTIRILEALLQDELRHEERLLEQYNRLRKELQIETD